MKRRKKKGIFFKFNFYLFLDQTRPNLKKDRKINLRSDSTVLRSNSTYFQENI